eukprot:SAG22_NODE_16820_length_317_cov_0.701835_1_plen_41_part_10
MKRELGIRVKTIQKYRPKQYARRTPVNKDRLMPNNNVSNSG